MTGRSSRSIFDEPIPEAEDWDVADPFGYELAIYRKIRDEIEARVEDLAQRLREKSKSAGETPSSFKAAKRAGEAS